MNESNKQYSLVLDAGTTAVKALVVDSDDVVVSKAQKTITKSHPQSGWVEQDPKEILQAARDVLREVVRESNVPVSRFSGMGIATQRETVIAWNRQTSDHIYPAIVWQDERTAEWCKSVSQDTQTRVREKTGLPIDPYFSASKIRWILENVPEAQELQRERSLALGTVDSWLLWNLGKGTPHVTDSTNASRTLVFNIRDLTWDSELLSLFNISPDILPTHQPSISSFGVLDESILGEELPIVAVAGDQQASLYAAGSKEGVTKTTFGTGTFVMHVIGNTFMLQDPFFTTLAVHSSKKPWYALEAKATSGIDNAEEVLRNPTMLQQHLEHIVSEAYAYVQKLPTQPSEIVIDGGWIRDRKILPIYTSHSSIPVREQIMYDGTALGIHRMIQEQLKR